MDYRLIVKNLQLSIEHYFKNGIVNYNNVINVLEEVYRTATMGQDPSFMKRMEDIIAQLGSAMQIQDEILFIDVIEYELIPALNWRP